MSRKLLVVFGCSIGLIFVLLLLPSQLIKPAAAFASPISSPASSANLHRRFTFQPNGDHRDHQQ